MLSAIFPGDVLSLGSVGTDMGWLGWGGGGGGGGGGGAFIEIGSPDSRSLGLG